MSPVVVIMAAAVVADAATSRVPNTPPGEWPGEQARFLNRAALRAGSQETCGLILGSREGSTLRIHRLSHCENHSEDPEQRFRIPAAHLMACDRAARFEDLLIVGAWHSHPGGQTRPSHSDLKELPEGWLGLIVTPNPEGPPGLQTYGRAGRTLEFLHA
jgi:proteasome lid subunit RPN8/RPN11